MVTPSFGPIILLTALASCSGEAAAAAVRPVYGRDAGEHGYGGRNAYVKGFREEMQRQYDAAGRLPR
eukprot:gene2147-2465_t